MYTEELYHYGIRGQRHGVRRFQNEDGSLTDAGRRRYADDSTERRRSTNDPVRDSGPGLYGSEAGRIGAIRSTRQASRRQEEFRPSEKGDKDMPAQQIAYAIGHYQKKASSSQASSFTKRYSGSSAGARTVSRVRSMPASELFRTRRLK